MAELLDYLYIIPAALIAIVCHEMAHGYVSYWLGDPTPKYDGRLSFNPLNHIDPMGILCLIVFQVGWAKPVMVDSRYYKNPKWGIALVSLAGPLVNFVLAFISAFLYVLLIRFAVLSNVTQIVLKFLLYLSILNIGLGVFNLIPIPPLDGSKIIGAILPDTAYQQYMKYQKYGMFFILGLILLLNILTMYGFPSILDEILNAIFNFFYTFWIKIFF